MNSRSRPTSSRIACALGATNAAVKPLTATTRLGIGSALNTAKKKRSTPDLYLLETIMKMQFTGWVFARQYRWESKPAFDFITSSMDSADEYVKITEPITIEVDVPDSFDIREFQVANLRKQQQELDASYTAKKTELESKIQSLLAIESSVTPVAIVDDDSSYIPF